MQVGVTFPQTEIGKDPVAIRDYAQAVEGLGYKHLVQAIINSFRVSAQASQPCRSN